MAAEIGVWDSRARILNDLGVVYDNLGNIPASTQALEEAFRLNR